MTPHRLHVVRPLPPCVTPTEEIARLDVEEATESQIAAFWLLFRVFGCGVVAGSLMAWAVLGLVR
jgi:hypothetical protein